MQAQEILNLQATKTEKIKQLLALGLTRKQVAELMGVGYGFVQNVYSSMNGSSRAAAMQQIFVLTAFSRKFGIEIEAYGVDKAKLVRALNSAGILTHTEGYNHVTRNHWKVISDSSITGDNAFELVSPILEGEDGIEQVRKVSQVLVALRVKINKTCGMHIHFDAEGMNLQTWKNLFKNYINYEGIIDSFMPTSRRANNNTYCKSLLNGLSKEQIFRKIDACNTISQIASYYSSRYFKVNAQSYSRHNTVEFRQHSGTIEFDKIEMWVRFLHNLVSFSQTKTTTQSDFESLSTFNQPEILDYLHARIQSLAS